MKTLFAIMAFLASFSAFAVTQYEGGGRLFPDELSMDGLPEAIPCLRLKNGFGVEVLSCTWLFLPRNIQEWDPESQRTMTYPNRMEARCVRGTCNTKTYKAGNWPEDIAVRLQIWYYIAESSDGKPVAYLFGTGPNYDGDRVSYREAGSILHQFYLDSNMSDDLIKEEMGHHYDGGYIAWKSGKIETQEKVDVVVKEARCAPQLDDSCFINGKQVPKVELRNYLPVVQETTVEAAGGFCEYPICYDRNDKPIGIRPY